MEIQQTSPWISSSFIWEVYNKRSHEQIAKVERDKMEIILRETKWLNKEDRMILNMTQSFKVLCTDSLLLLCLLIR